MAIDNTNKRFVTTASSYANQTWMPIDALYGPWNSFKEFIETALQTNGLDEDFVDNFLKNDIPVGLTIAIIDEDTNKVVEYWNPVEGEGFVKKSGEFSSVDDIYETITANEKTVAAALNDLNKRIPKVWNSLDEAKSFIIKTGEGASAYPGMIITVINNGEPELYVVKYVGDDAIDSEGNFNEDCWMKIGSMDGGSYDSLNDIIINDEKVIAVALNDLNSRINNNEITVKELTGDEKDSKYVSEYQFKKGDKDLIKIGIPRDSSGLESCRYISQDSNEAHAGSLEMVYVLSDGSKNTVYVDISETLVASELRQMIASKITNVGEDKDKFVTSGMLYDVLESFLLDDSEDSDDDSGYRVTTAGNVIFSGNLDDSFVTNTTVGFLEAGTEITSDMTIKDILLKILTKELWAGEDTIELPKHLTFKVIDTQSNKVVSNITGEKEFFEVGKTVKLSLNSSYSLGYIGSYNGTNKIEKIQANVGFVNDSNKLKVINGSNDVEKKSSENIEICLQEGNIYCTNKINYTDSTAITISNYGNSAGPNDEHGLKINGGTLENTIRGRAAYKIWYGNLPVNYDGNNTATWATTNTSAFVDYAKGVLTQGWSNESNDVILGSGDNNIVTNDGSHYYFLICPEKYILHGTQSNNIVSVVYDETKQYTHTLENGSTVKYNIYVWKAVNQTYNNVKMMTKTNYINIGGKL